ncbi:hypothetical protein BS78_02G154600, partial [Paspalum vaginatum]
RHHCRQKLWEVIEESGWSLVPTCFGGFLPLRVVPSSGELGLLLVFKAPDPLSPGDAMAGGHLQPARSAISVIWLLRLPVTRTTGSLQGLEWIFFLFQTCLCKFWDVITKNH